MKTFPVWLLTVSILTPAAGFAADWSKHRCPADEAACLTIDDTHKPAPPKGLESGRIVFAFGTDGCLASAPVWYDGDDKAVKPNPGIALGGAKNGHCSYANQLNKAYIVYNEIVSKSDPSYKARIFGLYAVKDQATAMLHIGHRHEWEHAIVWLHNDQPEYVSTTEHKGLNTKKAEDAAHLKNNPNAFGVKYIIKKTTHYLDFASGDKNHVVDNPDPTPDKSWFASSDAQLVDYRQASDQFKSIIDDRANWGETVPRVNDPQFLNDHKPGEWKNITF
ncbi:MAG: NPP1 family protein [Gluconacetobacter liquefaciens]